MMENLVPIFIAVTAAAVVLQAGILVGLYVAVRKTTAKLESEVAELKVKTLPIISSTDGMLVELRPKVDKIVDNLVQLHPKILQIVDALVELRPKLNIVVDNFAETSSTVRSEIQRVDATVSDVMDRARLQVIRADEMLTRTFDRVEHTSDVVAKTVVSPVRQVSGIVRGVTAGVEFLLASRGRKNGDSRSPRRPVPQDEMFI
jgi:methyl-accepting chemotaxis protein